MFFKQQINYNRDKVNRLTHDLLLKKTATATSDEYGIESVQSADADLLNKVIDISLARYGITRPTATERASVCKIIADHTHSGGILKSGFCLRKNNVHHDVDLHFHEKKARCYSHPSVPNFTYLEIDGVPYGVKEEMDYVDVVSI